MDDLAKYDHRLGCFLLNLLLLPWLLLLLHLLVLVLVLWLLYCLLLTIVSIAVIVITADVVGSVTDGFYRLTVSPLIVGLPIVISGGLVKNRCRITSIWANLLVSLKFVQRHMVVRVVLAAQKQFRFLLSYFES